MTSAGPTARPPATDPRTARIERRAARAARAEARRAGPSRLGVLGLAAALLALAAAAYRPLFTAPLRAPDLRLLARAAAGPEADPPAGAPEGVRPLGTLSLGDLYAIDPRGSLLGNAELALQARATGWRGSGAGAWPLRASGIALHLVAAVALALFLRRCLLPWTGSEHAAAAASAALLLHALHPFAASLVGDLGARADLWALALSASSAALFLRGRQDRRAGATAGAALLAVLAGFGGGAALYLPFVLALAELFSAHRYRPLRDRLRTAVNTLFVFGAAVGVDVAVRAWAARAAGAPFAPAPLLAEGAAADAFGRIAERVGLFVVPVNAQVGGAVGIVAALAVLLLALHPALVAARSAPRLWGWMLVLWFVGLAAGAAHRLGFPVSLHAATHAHALAAGAAVMAAGLGAGATALRGLRRTWTPWAAAVVYAALLHAAAVPWRAAGHEVTELRRDLAAARERWGNDARVLVLDPSAAVRGVEPYGDALPWLAHPALEEGAAGGARGEVRGLSEAAFLALAREPELERLRRAPLVVLAGAEALGAELEPLRTEGRRVGVLLPEPAPSGMTRTWRREVRSPDLDLAALEASWFRASAPPEAVPSGELRLRWRATEPGLDDGTLPLVRVVSGAQEALVADLGSSLAWRLGGRVRRVWIEGGLGLLSDAAVLDRPPDLRPAGERPAGALAPAGAPPPAPPLAPDSDGEDWYFSRPRAAEVAPERGRYVLELLSLASYQWVELPVEMLGEEHLIVRGAAGVVGSMEAPVAWTLDWRVDGVALARASGRRVGRDGTVEQRR